MSKSTIRSLLTIVVLVLLASAYALGRWMATQEAAAYAHDITTHLMLSCSNEELVALTDLREGKTQDAIRGLELIVAAKLEGIDVARIPATAVARKSLESLRGPLLAYQQKFPATALDPNTNRRLESFMRAMN